MTFVQLEDGTVIDVRKRREREAGNGWRDTNCSHSLRYLQAITWVVVETDSFGCRLRRVY